MPIHDWTCVPAGIWHAFHVSWIVELQNRLNGGVLPGEYYALAEQITDRYGPDVLTLHSEDVAFHAQSTGGIAVAVAPPRTKFVADAEIDEYAAKRRTLSIRHVTGDRVVAFVEVISPGNKSSQPALRSIVEKSVDMIQRGCHLLVIDLFPPTTRDPHGLHAEIWRNFSETEFVPPAGEPLTLAAYAAGIRPRAYVEPIAVGRVMPDMPLFLDSETYVNVPLESAYASTFGAFPQHLRRELRP